MREQIKQAIPASWVPIIRKQLFWMRRAKIRAIHKTAELLGYNVSRRADYYSTLPNLSELAGTVDRWFKPSALVGVRYDLRGMKNLFSSLHEKWYQEFSQVTGNYKKNLGVGFGPGYPFFDSVVLYYMIRELKPARYLEIGSGLSTYYCKLAGDRNAQEGKPLRITCIEPYPSRALKEMSGTQLIVDVCQNVPLSTFEQLEAGDVLFIDSSHAMKIDSDVTYLYLEVVPRLKPGVYVHIHDVPFPYNIPFPPSTWILGERWPVYWNEAMLVQAFLAFNDSFETVLSTPLIRYDDELFFASRMKEYILVEDDPNPYSSLWIRRSK